MRFRVAPDALNSGALAHHPLEGPGPEPSDDYPLRVPCCSYLSIEAVSFAARAREPHPSRLLISPNRQAVQLSGEGVVWVKRTSRVWRLKERLPTDVAPSCVYPRTSPVSGRAFPEGSREVVRNLVKEGNDATTTGRSVQRLLSDDRCTGSQSVARGDTGRCGLLTNL